MQITHGFQLVQEQDIPEINTRARLFKHITTGAELLSLENDDENKVFGITFRTPPPDSSGLPHIMEHSVLCGSEKYPLKEPFVELLKGSLQTFLNAFTYPDKTCYPVASQNLQDFYNLIDVYVDAVFHPLIPPRVLEQEGWHYELENINDPLVYKGVVFNEMKGAYSDPNNLLARYASQSLFPDTPYGLDSGGDPAVIPNLTYSQFKSFHEKYYHPSNARIFFYGDDDPDERLRRMQGYLSEYSAISVDSQVPLQPVFPESKRLVIPFDPGDDPQAAKGMLVMNWMLPGSDDELNKLAWHILVHILIGTPASPLRKALIDSGLGEDLAGVGLDSELRQPYFSTGLKGMRVGADHQLVDGERLENLVRQTLENLAQEGIDRETIAASLNTVEFNLRENNTGAFPRGLALMLRALITWLYDKDPFAPLAFEAGLSQIKQRLAAGEPFFENMIQVDLLSNKHHSVVILQPQPGYNQIMDEAEQEKLAKVRAAMSSFELQAVLENTKALNLHQETPDPPEALATIPSLKPQDLETVNKIIPIEVLDGGAGRILYHDLFTNGILYLDLAFDLHVLPQELLPYIPLFGRSLVEMGTQTEDFVQLSQRIGRSTGGISSNPMVLPRFENQQSSAWLVIRGKTTMAQAGELLAILEDVLSTVRLDNPERFRQMVLEEKAAQEASLVPAGHRVVNSRLRGLFNEADWATEKMGGVDYLFFLRSLLEKIDHDWQSVFETLERVRESLVMSQNSLSNVTLDAENWKSFQPMLEDFITSLPVGVSQVQGWQPEPRDVNEGLVIPAQVNYVGKGADLYKLGYRRHGSIDVIMNYLRTTWLWEKVRVQGGAYGGFSLFNQRSGILTFLSYRDPNLLSTLDVYDQTAGFLRQLDSGRLSQEEIDRSIVGAIGDLDAYQLPDAKGLTSMVRYLVGDTEAARQLWRDQVLHTSLSDFSSLGEILQQVNDNGAVVILGSQEAIQAANTARPGWLQIRKVL